MFMVSQEQYVDYCLWYLDNHIPDCIAPRDSIAGVMIEPGLAEGGNWIPPTTFLRGIRELCDKNDWLMIADEVLTGIGRTGKMWAVEHYDVIPDILVVGKNLSGGIACGLCCRHQDAGDLRAGQYRRQCRQARTACRRCHAELGGFRHRATGTRQRAVAASWFS